MPKNQTTPMPPPFYVPNPWLRKEYAWNLAIELDLQIERGSVVELKEWNQITLFKLLHTCAFKAGRATTERQRDLWLSRWNRIRNYIAEQNVRLVTTSHHRYAGIMPDEDDRISEGFYAYHRAIARFNPWKGWKFSTYAMNAIYRSYIHRARREFRRRKRFPVSYDPAHDNPEMPDEGLELYVERLRPVLENNEAMLSQVEKDILKRRFPMDGSTPLTLQQIGDLIGLSKERARQIQERALRKIRAVLENDPVLL
jgi:RNA polymerase primary sigma factor